MKKANIKKIIFYLFTFFILNGTIYLITYLNDSAKIKMSMNHHLNNLNTHYRILLHHQKGIADNAYASTMNVPELVNIISQAYKTKSDIELTILRNRLKKILDKKYSILIKKGVLQYHFVFPDNKVFLRMHKPSKFGDDLTKIRTDFAYINKHKKIVRGFSQGKTAHAFRNIYPIFDKNKEYIGAMEISFGSEILQNELTEISKIHTHFLVNKKIFDSKAWPRNDLMLKYVPSPEDKSLMFTLTGNHNEKRCIIDNKRQLKPIKEKISKNISYGKKFSVYIPHDTNHINTLLFYPIKQSMSKKTVAWIVAYENNKFIYSILKMTFIVRVISFLILLIFFGFINQKRILNEQIKKRNIKIQEKKDELEKINKKLESYSYTISHDLKEPIRSIRTFSEFILEDYEKGFNEEAKDYFSRIIKASSKMALMIDDLLILSKVGRTDIKFKNISIKKIVKEVESMLQQKINETNTKLIINNLPQIICQSTWIQAVFQNLKSNSIKYNNKKEIIIEISYKEFDKYHEFSVKDNGRGIKKDQHDKIFGLFRKAHQDKNIEGSGAGLAIVSSVIEQHNGKIWVDWSEIDKGTDFKFTISKDLISN